MLFDFRAQNLFFYNGKRKLLRQTGENKKEAETMAPEQGNEDSKKTLFVRELEHFFQGSLYDSERRLGLFVIKNIPLSLVSKILCPNDLSFQLASARGSVRASFIDFVDICVNPDPEAGAPQSLRALGKYLSKYMVFPSVLIKNKHIRKSVGLAVIAKKRKNKKRKASNSRST